MWRKREALARTLARRPDLLGSPARRDERRWLDEGVDGMAEAASAAREA